MYREIVVRAYAEEAKSKIDKIRNSGINMTHLILDLLLELDIEEYKKQNSLQHFTNTLKA